MKKMEPIMKKIAVIALILLLFFTGACAREEAVLKPDDAITIAVTVDCVSILNNSNVSQKGRDLLDLLIEKDLSDQKGLMFRGDVNIAPAQSAFHALQNTGLEPLPSAWPLRTLDIWAGGQGRRAAFRLGVLSERRSA